MTAVARGRLFFCHAALTVLIATPMVAMARDNFETSVDYNGLAVAIDRAVPVFPRHVPRRLQEAWVQVNYVVTPDGRAIDPIIVNSSGGPEFEDEVRKVTQSWRFEPSVTGAELPFNVANTRFTLRGRGKGTTRRFARFAQHIMKGLHNGDVEAARKEADAALNLGGWNLYESTILWLMVGRVEGAEGDEVGQLEMYRRGLAVSDELSLQREARIDLLEDMFGLEANLGQYSAAMQTLSVLSEIRGSKAAVERLTARAEEITTMLENEPVLVANAIVVNPCDCDAGKALWDYVPVRRTFSFANLNGNVERFEARCELQRLSGVVETDQQWTLEADWGFCQIFVFGDDGATFEFLEHSPDTEGSDAVDETTVARNHVLDRRSRSQ
jgi:TonB family protein